MSTDPLDQRPPMPSTASVPRVRVELLCHEDCPHAQDARVLLHECLAEVGLTATLIERVGAHPSPTVLVNGRDIMGEDGPPAEIAVCRLDLPTRELVRAALREARGARPE